MAGGVYPVICSRLYLSAYGKDHYEILHWWICLLENVLAAPDNNCDCLYGGADPDADREKKQTVSVIVRLYVHLC